MKKNIFFAIAFVMLAQIVIAQTTPSERPTRPPARPRQQQGNPAQPTRPQQGNPSAPRPQANQTLRNERNPYANFRIFYIDEIERDDGEIEIEFNMPFNPESVLRENILINDAPLPPHVPMSFNRRGNKINIKEMPEWSGQEIVIEIKKIRSINDLEMQQLDAFYLGNDDSYEWDEPHKVRWATASGTE